MPDLAKLSEDLGPDEAAKAARSAIEIALEPFTPLQRDQFWTAIGLYYSTRRHPGSDETEAGRSKQASAWEGSSATLPCV